MDGFFWNLDSSFGTAEFYLQRTRGFRFASRFLNVCTGAGAALGFRENAFKCASFDLDRFRYGECLDIIARFRFLGIWFESLVTRFWLDWIWFWWDSWTYLFDGSLWIASGVRYRWRFVGSSRESLRLVDVSVCWLSDGLSLLFWKFSRPLNFPFDPEESDEFSRTSTSISRSSTLFWLSCNILAFSRSSLFKTSFFPSLSTHIAFSFHWSNYQDQELPPLFPHWFWRTWIWLDDSNPQRFSWN